MEGNEPADDQEKLDLVEESAKASLRALIGDDNGGGGGNVLDLARDGEVDFSSAIPKEAKKIISEGKDPVEVLFFLREMINRTLEDLSEKNSEHRDTDNTN